jgi:hypothetical protein
MLTRTFEQMKTNLVVTKMWIGSCVPPAIREDHLGKKKHGKNQADITLTSGNARPAL